MGFESFQVVLRGGDTPAEKIIETLRELPNVRPDGESHFCPGDYFLFDDGRHKIEIEASPGRVSCRFMLCHPPTVDAVLVALMRELMTRLGMTAEVLDDDGPERVYSIDQIAELEAAVSSAAGVRRAEWVAMFGDAQFPATTREVYERIILPACDPISGEGR